MLQRVHFCLAVLTAIADVPAFGTLKWDVCDPPLGCNAETYTFRDFRISRVAGIPGLLALKRNGQGEALG